MFAGVIVVLLVALTALGLVMSNTINSLQTDKTSLQSQFASLQSNNTQLQSNYNSLQSQYNRLQSLFTSLQSNNSQLQNNYNSLQSQYNSLQSQFASLQSNNSQLQNNYNSLQSQFTSLQSNYNLSQSQIANLQSQIASLQSQLSNATALITQLQGPTGILPTYMDLCYVGPQGSGGAYFLQLSLKNTGTVPITEIFVTLNSVLITMTFTYLNTTISASAPLPSYQTTTGIQNVTPPIYSVGTYPMIIQALATNGTIYTYQTTITSHA
jgi:chaperonin cofactor prefoldin